jgi:hypothetical protein
MNPAHIHLLLNHIPVLGTAFGILLLLFGILRKNNEAKRFGLVMFLLCGLIAIPVFLTGEPAEEIVEHQIGIDKEAIEEHEDSATWALVSVEVLAVLSLISLFLFHKTAFPGWAMVIVMLIALVTSGIIARTANLGGMINHPEITGTAVQTGEDED